MTDETRTRLIQFAATCGIKPAEAMKLLVDFGISLTLELNKGDYNSLMAPEAIRFKVNEALKRTVKVANK